VVSVALDAIASQQRWTRQRAGRGWRVFPIRRGPDSGVSRGAAKSPVSAATPGVVSAPAASHGGWAGKTWH